MTTLVTLATPTADDADEFLAAAIRSRLLHGDWVAAPATSAAYQKYLERTLRDDFAAFLVRRVEDRSLAGVINISHIIGEPLSSAFLGFYAFAPHARQGFLHAGLQLALAQAFGERNLHRIEANIQPQNVASISLVRKLGFRREGFSPKYLRIAGEWRDHERWALLAEELNTAAAAKAP
jgi:ribosomal-protein-alanine N-acetyltransferase